MMKITPQQAETVHRLVQELCANCDKDGNCIFQQLKELILSERLVYLP